MKQLRSLFAVGLLMLSIFATAQDKVAEDASNLKIQVTDMIGLEQYASQSDLLKNKLNQAVVLNGGASLASQFLLVPKVFVVSKQAVPGTPAQYIVELQLHLYLVDAVEKVILQQTSFDLKGVALSEAKAVTQALNNFQARNPQLKTFIVKGKEKIISHYKKNCKKIIARVNSNIKRGNYEAAMLELSSIPDISSECYEEAMNLMEQISEIQQEEALRAIAERELDLQWIGNR